jgi:hypothetical protein
MLRRGLLVSGLGLSLTVAGAGVFGQGSALAQDASDNTSPSQTTEVTREERRPEWDAAQLAQYENFLAKFAENLGISDPAQVETAFKDTLKDLIDEQFEAGDISANAAEELKTQIDEANLHDIFGFGGFGRGDRMIGFDRHHHGDRGPRGMERRVKIWSDGPLGEMEVERAPDDVFEVGGESRPETDEPEMTPTS